MNMLAGGRCGVLRETSSNQDGCAGGFSTQWWGKEPAVTEKGGINSGTVIADVRRRSFSA